MRILAAVCIVTLLLLSTTGCLSFGRKPAPMTETSSAGPSTTACSGNEEPAEEIRALNARHEAQRIELLAARAETEALRAQLQTRQSQLDEAIQEVVRARAKQRSVESRAQAATEITETEIAFERLPAAVRGSTEAERAGRLLVAAGQAFDEENFGGALYLATQSKGRIRSATQAVSGTGLDGETLFNAPVRLAVVRRSNVRQGPGTEFRILRTIDAGTELTGHASKGAWIRATDDRGSSGWIHRSLIGGS